MKYSAVSALADSLKTEYKTNDPTAICEGKGINIMYQPMGNHQSAIKGFVIGVDGVFTVVVNSDLPENIRRVIIAHELCHALMHCEGRVAKYSDTAVFDDISEKEREANLFAAQLLIDDSDVINQDEDITFFQLAARLCVPAELLDFKFILLKEKHPDLPSSPINSHNNFLRSIKTKNE